MPIQFTTDLPDAQQPTLDGSNDNEITATWTDTIDNGSYRGEYREAGTSTWNAGFLVDESNTSATITGLNNTEKYEVQIRTETDHATGSWTTEVARWTPVYVTFGASSSGSTSFTEETVADESISVAGAGSVDFASFTTTASESFAVEGTGSIDVNEMIRADRVATVSGDGAIETNSEFTDVFPSQSSTDLNFNLITDPVLGFASEWVYEDSQFDDPTAFSTVLDINSEGPFNIRVQYRENDTGPADYTTSPEEVTRDNQIHTWDELGEDGYYRLIVSEMRPENHLRAVTWGPTRL